MNFDAALQSMKNQSFSKDKLNMAKSYISGNMVQSAQMAEIVKLFSFPDERSEIAIFGYTYVVDPGSYFVVSDAMTFMGEKDKLNKHIAANRREMPMPGYNHGGFVNTGYPGGAFVGGHEGGYGAMPMPMHQGGPYGGGYGAMPMPMHQGGPYGGAFPGFVQVNAPVMNFEAQLESLKKQSFAKDRMNMAKSYISGNYLQSSHMAEIMKLFSFPDERAEIAIFGYGRVVDPGNYFVVHDAMTFIGEKQKLNDHIAANRR